MFWFSRPSAADFRRTDDDPSSCEGEAGGRSAWTTNGDGANRVAAERRRQSRHGDPASSPAEMTERQLARAWRVSCIQLDRAARAGDIETVTAAVTQRAWLLEELRLRRGAHAFARWVDRETTSSADPTRYLAAMIPGQRKPR